MPQPSRRLQLAGAALLLVLGSGLQAQDPPPASTAADFLFQTGVSALSAGKYHEAEINFRRLIELEPASSRGILGLAQVYLAQKKQDEALRLLQAESEKAPRNVELHFAIGNLALQSAKFDLAIAEFHHVLDASDRNSNAAAQLYFLLGEAHRRKGDIDASVALYQQAQKLLPGNLPITNALAFVLDATGKRQAAEAEYRKIIEADPKNALAMNNLAFLLADDGTDLDLALAYALRARQLAPNEYKIADTLGWVYLKMKSTDEAIAMFRDAVEKDPASVVYRYHLAMALGQKGERAEAAKELQTALKNNPSKAEEQMIRELLQQIGQ